MLQHSHTLERQKHAASEANRYWFLARYRILEGYFGAAKFYQWQSARWHQKAVELRAQYDREKLFNSIPDREPRALKLAMSSAYGKFRTVNVTDPVSGMTFAIPEYASRSFEITELVSNHRLRKPAEPNSRKPAKTSHKEHAWRKRSSADT